METTSKLYRELHKLDDSPSSFQQFRMEHPTPQEFRSLSDYLNMYMAKHPDLVQKEIIANAGQSKDYGNQIFNGIKKHPNKYILIPICIAMGMNVKEIDRALFLANCPKLAPQTDLDAALIICVNKHYRTLNQINDFLFSVGLNPLS